MPEDANACGDDCVLAQNLDLLFLVLMLGVDNTECDDGGDLDAEGYESDDYTVDWTCVYVGQFSPQFYK